MKEYLTHHQYFSYALQLGSSILISLIAIPSIIHVSKLHQLYDDLSKHRKSHSDEIPRLGGIAIFVSFTITLLLFGIADTVIPINYLLASCILMFAMGIKDDLSGVNPGTKIVLQFLASMILVVPGKIRIANLYGLFDIYELNLVSSIILSVFFIMFITNAFNLIDGIDGLAASTGILVNGSFSILFIYMHQMELATVSLTMTGAILGFIKFNLSPAKIFMGDTGSLLIGLISSVMALKFFSLEDAPGTFNQVYATPAIAIIILMGPISDTIRVLLIRTSNGTSPFRADRNHTHHMMLRLGLTHLQATAILISINMTGIVLAIAFADSGSASLITYAGIAYILFNWVTALIIKLKTPGPHTIKQTEPLNS
ncbi:hypothetical protein PBAL39_05058 [Pedobacter sp. BAL39]|uniref:MraY family glycosyltransferase n=1 Tax=Pedobacter sp. BAL39 TaxID=391596 RepID=UPI00015594F3|nr:MraY family glycosyltransferase [Pedobacter sp. BAL39]EDM37140.1 hypothetical protein PBAL39_05058 [Pedobacter sp. BAL39]